MTKKNMTKLFFSLMVVFLTSLSFGYLYLKIRKERKRNIEIVDIEDYKNVLLYSKSSCRYCIMAKNLLEQKNINFYVIELTGNKDLHLKLLEQTGQRTVPYVFIDDKFIGGYTDLKNLIEKNESIKK